MTRFSELIQRFEEYDEDLAEELEMEHMDELCDIAQRAGEGVGALFVRLCSNIGGPFEDGFVVGCAAARGEESWDTYVDVADHLEDLAHQARQHAEFLRQEETGEFEDPDTML